MGGIGFLVKQELKFSLHINFPSMFNFALFYHAYLLHSFFPFQPNVTTSPGKFIESKHELLFCIYTPKYYVSASNSSFWWKLFFFGPTRNTWRCCIIWINTKSSVPFWLVWLQQSYHPWACIDRPTQTLLAQFCLTEKNRLSLRLAQPLWKCLLQWSFLVNCFCTDKPETHVNLLTQTPGHDLILQNALQKKKQNLQTLTAGKSFYKISI